MDPETSPDTGEDHHTADGSEDDDIRALISRTMHGDQMEVNDNETVKKSRAQYYPAPPEPHTCSWGAFCNR